MLAWVTLISVRFLLPALWTCSKHISVGEESVARITFQLSHWSFFSLSIFLQRIENFVGYFSLFFSRSPAKITEIDVKEILYFLMLNLIFLTDLFICESFFHSFELCCCSLLVCTTYLDSVLTHESALSVLNITT